MSLSDLGEPFPGCLCLPCKRVTAGRYDATEQDKVIEVFAQMLRAATKDGGRKRAAGLKEPWWRDPGHISAFYRHLEQYEANERFATDSGVHHMISIAWRALAIAHQELNGKVEP